MRLICVLLTLALVCAARAGSPMPVRMKCPVGGKKFTYISTASMSQWGSRPDGKPYGSWTFPMPLPECPDNGLVMYRDFTGPEIKQLKSLLVTAEFRKLRADRETPYYLAYWLMQRLADPDMDQAWVLQQASWEADGQPALKRRYQEEFVQRVQTLPKPRNGEDDLGWIVMQFRAANALRELGRFDESAALLDAVPVSSLDVPVPEEKVSGTTPSGYGRIVENHGEIRAAQNRRSWLGYPAQQRVAIARRDASSQPIDMVPLRVAMNLCEAYPKSAPEYAQVCESEAMRAQKERARKLRERVSPAASPAQPVDAAASANPATSATPANPTPPAAPAPGAAGTPKPD